MVLIIAASTLMHVYVFRRIQSVPFISRRIPGKVLVFVFFTLWLTSLIAHPLGHYDPGLFAVCLEWFGLHWLGSLFIVFTTLLVLDIATGFGYFLPRFASRFRGVALLASSGFVLLAFIQGMRPPVVSDYETVVANLPPQEDGTVIVVLSDLHIGALLDQNWLSERAKQVAALKPDFLFLVGDLIEGHGPAGTTQDLLPVLGRLKASKGVYLVAGNHERHMAGGSGLRLFEDAGFYPLRDTWTRVSPGIILAGIDDPSVRAAKEAGKDPFPGILAGRPDGMVTILLSHRPDLVREAAEAGVNIMFSGHTHGGQIWPFGEISRIVHPFLEGLYVVDGMSLFVSRGTGTWGPCMRLWRPGEIVRVRLFAPTRGRNAS
ncbi:MAG: metallophosphoesterase [Myxococcota bacterium]|jgi:hypothetical protein